MSEARNDAIAQLVNEKIEADLANIRLAAEKKLADNILIIEERLEKQLRTRLLTIALAIVSLAGAVLVTGMYSTTREVNAAVISLQKDILSAQTVIQTSAKALQESQNNLSKAQNDLKIAADQMNEQKSKYDSLLRELTQAQKK